MKKYILGLSVLAFALIFSFGLQKALAQGAMSPGLTATVTPAPAGPTNTSYVSGSSKETATPLSAQTTFTQSLIIGSKGDEVKNLQNFLISKGFLANGSNTGTFGTKTSAAVKAFQLVNKLSTVGTVGPATRAALNELIKIADNNSPLPTTRSMPAGGCNVGKEMIAINTDATVHVRGKLGIFGPGVFPVTAWGYTFNSDSIAANSKLVGSVANGPQILTTGDIIDISGTYSTLGIISPLVVRDQSADCRAAAASGSDNTSGQITPAGN